MSLKIFIGYDYRQPLAYHVLAHSILSRSSVPVSITPLVLETLPIKRQGLTPFTFSRFIVPYLCDFKGWALFLDIDMILQDDISKLFSLADDKYSVMVSRNKLKFEWASAILFNCEKNKQLTPEFVESADGLHQINWLKDEEIGGFPNEWNHLVGYDTPKNGASLVHYTQGIPCFPETKDSEYAAEWENEHKALNSAMPWATLMGNSVHALVKDGKPVPRYKVEPPK